MASEYITQCPQCDTRFKVTLEQLNKAHGLVRCGSCMKVFSADQQLVSAETESESIQVSKPSRNKASKTIPEVPLQLRQTNTKRSPLASFIWGSLTVFGCLGLILQVLWFERAQLSRYPDLSNLYQQGCQYIDCRLSARQDIPLITNHQLMVRDHPKYLGALAVDLLLENQAPFPQPFPAIQLIFSDINGEPKAARSVQPDEYLGGDFGNRQLMPSKKPIQVQIEILDPGSEAPNYHLQFVQPQQSS